MSTKPKESLTEYESKRNFAKTPEPKAARQAQDKIFVIHKHAASHLHYDLRLSDGRVLKSWAVPHGLPRQKAKKNFAKLVEAHPLDYQFFEGKIPEAEYGGGSVMIYDRGRYESKKLDRGIQKGHIKIHLFGKKFQGTFNLIKLNSSDDWLITADQDSPEIDPLTDRSAASDELMAEIFLEKKIDLSLIAKTPFSEVENNTPMLCQSKNEIFDSEDYVFEPKLDGYRSIARVDYGSVELISRNGQSFKDKFRSIYLELKKFKYAAVFDGEIVILNEKGVPNFSLLQNADPNDPRLYYYVFDILSFEHHDLRSLPLIQRKAALEQIIPSSSRVRYVPHVKTKGKKFFESLKSSGFEGIVAKKASGRYQHKRSDNCLKIKAFPQIDAVIVGYTKPKGTREFFGSLALAKDSPEGLEFLGFVGTGFDTETLGEIYKKLQTLPEGYPLTNAKNTTWIEPRYFARVEYLEQTPSGQLRHPVFRGILEDRTYTPTLSLAPNNDISLKLDGHKITISNPEKIFFPELKITKLDLINYYIKNASLILPFLQDRPENLHRYPDGIYGEHFYHKDTRFKDSPLGSFKVYSETDKRSVNYSVIKGLAGLVYLVNLGCIELNPWLSKTDTIDKPDMIVFDLDPGDKIDFKYAIQTALLIKFFLTRSESKLM